MVGSIEGVGSFCGFLVVHFGVESLHQDALYFILSSAGNIVSTWDLSRVSPM